MSHHLKNFTIQSFSIWHVYILVFEVNNDQMKYTNVVSCQCGWKPGDVSIDHHCGLIFHQFPSQLMVGPQLYPHSPPSSHLS